MLKRLTVRNLAIVEEVSVDFAPGLNVITGETGAGKSVLMGALDLVLGGRADASQVRDGAREAEVEACFAGFNKGKSKKEEGESAEPETSELVIRRTVTASGRTRAWVNDESVSVAELKELGKTLVDIHGPRANQNLLLEDFQRETLDAFGGVCSRGANTTGERCSRGANTTAYGVAYGEWKALKDRLAALLSAGGGEDELDLLRYQVSELEEAGLSAEDDDLAARHAAAAHAEEIVAAANEITEALGGDDNSVTAILSSLQPRFAAAAKHFPAAADWQTEAEDLTIRAEELSRTVADATQRIDADPAAFAEMDARLGVVNRLVRKYRVAQPSDLVQLLDAKKTKLSDLENRDEKVAELEREIAAAEKKVRTAGAALTKARRAAGDRLGVAVTAELRDLGFLQAKFGVRLTPLAPEPHGCDQVAYMFEPNPGESARPLADIASSGEIARVMLALKVVASEVGERVFAGREHYENTLVFDEIDANIGGEVGRVVGEKMRAVAAHHQVIAITHLPQSAVYGERHLVVSKGVTDGRTRTKIAEVSGAARVREIARMLGGEKLTSVVKTHAEELLKVGSRK